MTCRKLWNEEKLTNAVCLDQQENVKRKLLMCVHKDGLSVFIQILTGEPCKRVFALLYLLMFSCFLTFLPVAAEPWFGVVSCIFAAAGDYRASYEGDDECCFLC